MTFLLGFAAGYIVAWLGAPVVWAKLKELYKWIKKGRDKE